MCIFWSKQAMLQLTDFHLVTFVKEFLHFVQNRSFARSPRRIVIFQLHRLLLSWWFLGSAWQCRSDVQRRSFWWPCSALYSFWHRFERRTLRRGTFSDRFWHGLDKRSFNIHFCLALQSHTRFAFSGKSKRSAVQQTHNPNQKNPPHRPHSHQRKEMPQQAQTETQQEQTQKNPEYSQYSPPQKRDSKPRKLC